jgi:hypothetical protein
VVGDGKAVSLPPPTPTTYFWDLSISNETTVTTKNSTYSIRRFKERWGGRFFLLATVLPVALVLVIFVALLLRTKPILDVKSVGELLLGQIWLPFQGEFGFFPFIMGTLWVTGVAGAGGAAVLVQRHLPQNTPARHRRADEALDLWPASPRWCTAFGAWWRWCRWCKK